MHKAMRDKDEGFTLIELLVVIIIIGILAAIAIPVFLNQRKKGYEASMKSDLRTVANEEETYFTDKQTYSWVKTDRPGGKAQVNGGNSPQLSNGVSVKSLNTGVSGFCLEARSDKTAALWYYDSKGGGLTATNCERVDYSAIPGGGGHAQS